MPQDLKEAALKKEFDVLLVFMLDRIGGIDDDFCGGVVCKVRHRSSEHTGAYAKNLMRLK